ncbi:peptidylprolyl isomerase [Candidatus Saccharibacteria bacterium]|nr:peptidylprolyl isomerase [Candidatus Saccharibacteria bacterium]
MADKNEQRESSKKPKSQTSAPKRSLDVRQKNAAKPKSDAQPEAAEAALAPKTTPKPKPVLPEAPAVKAADSAPLAAAKTAPHASRKPLLIKIGVAIVAVVVVIIAIFAVLIYAFGSTSPVTAAVVSVVPYPAERVNGHFVSYNDYLFEVNANEKAYVSNAKLNNQTVVSWSSADGKKLLKQIKQHALTKLETDAITAQLATKYKVTVTSKEVDALINTLYQKYGGKDTLLKTLSQIYGWNLDDLKKVIYKQLLAQKVQTAVGADPAIDAQTKAKAEDVLTKLKAGADFAATAKQYSQATDASAGGDLGTVAKGQVEDAVYNAAVALPVGGTSAVIKTQYGYQILRVTDKSDAGIHMSHILIENVSFSDYFAGQQNDAKVKVFIKS